MDAGDRERPAPLSPERWAVVPGPDLPKIRKRERISEVALTRAMEDISRLRFVEPRRGRDARFTKAGAREGWVCRVGERNARTGKQGGFRAVLAIDRPARTITLYGLFRRAKLRDGSKTPGPRDRRFDQLVKGLIEQLRG